MGRLGYGPDKQSINLEWPNHTIDYIFPSYNLLSYMQDDKHVELGSCLLKY